MSWPWARSYLQWSRSKWLHSQNPCPGHNSLLSYWIWIILTLTLKIRKSYNNHFVCLSTHSLWRDNSNSFQLKDLKPTCIYTEEDKEDKTHIHFRAMSGSHTFLLVTNSYVLQATRAFLRMLPLFLLFFKDFYKVEKSNQTGFCLDICEYVSPVHVILITMG